MMNEKLFLIVEDDEQIRSFITFSLKSQHYRSILAKNGKEAINLIVTQNPDILILDLGLPDIDGLDIIRQVRSFSQIPIIVVSARDQDSEKVEVLDAGADDYITKPFSMNELLARLRVILRHISDKVDYKTQSIYRIGDLEVNLEKHTVTLENKEIRFTPIEFSLLSLLIKNTGKVLTHSYIIKQVWGSNIGRDSQTLRVFMASIRRKLEKDPAKPRYIITETGIGYRFADK